MIEPEFRPNPGGKGGKYFFLKDPDNQDYYGVNVAADLAVRGTTAASAVVLVQGVEAMTEALIEGGKITAKLTGLDITANAINKCTFRITCANGARFDRTIYFEPVDD